MAGVVWPTGGMVGGDEGKGGEAPLCKVQKGATRSEGAGLLVAGFVRLGGGRSLTVAVR